MELSKIQEHWDKDSQLDQTENANSISKASGDTSVLHAKYFRILSDERLRLRQFEIQVKERTALLWKYYSRMPLDNDEMEQLNIDPIENEKRILKEQIRYFIDADKELLKLQTKIEYQKEKVDFLESILKMLNNRTFQIKNIIEWKKFIAGM